MRVCKSCQRKLVRYELVENQIFYEKIDPYNHFEVNSKKHDIKVIVGEPNMLNPYSFENLASFLQSLGKRAKIDRYTCSGENEENRKWIFIENDVGLLVPVITYVCVSGGKKCSFFGKFGVLCLLETPVLRFALLPYYRRFIVARFATKQYMDEKTLILIYVARHTPIYEFDWLIPQSGLLHFEMNAGKSFMSLC